MLIIVTLVKILSVPQLVNSSDKIDIIINTHDDITDKLIDNMLTCLKEIEKQYPKNIKITNKEE